MPTPFYHLSIAEELLASPALDPAAKDFLHAHKGPFHLGKTAPDLQSLSGQTRPETHFYRVPLMGNNQPWKKMFARHPALGMPEKLSPDQRAFIAGYICHLQADVIWITDLFVPYFLPRITDGGRQQVGLLHNVLRAYLDEDILPGLPADLGAELAATDPSGWLPFAADPDLLRWRDYLARQLMPGSEIKTVEVFAERMHLPPETLSSFMHSEARMESEIFSFIPRHVLVKYRDKLTASNLELLRAYLLDHV